jgi:hypothetical protein
VKGGVKKTVKGGVKKTVKDDVKKTVKDDVNQSAWPWRGVRDRPHDLCRRTPSMLGSGLRIRDPAGAVHVQLIMIRVRDASH